LQLSVHLGCTEKELAKIRGSCMAMQQTQENEKWSWFFLSKCLLPVTQSFVIFFNLKVLLLEWEKG